MPPQSCLLSFFKYPHQLISTPEAQMYLISTPIRRSAPSKHSVRTKNVLIIIFGVHIAPRIENQT